MEQPQAISNEKQALNKTQESLLEIMKSLEETPEKSFHSTEVLEAIEKILSIKMLSDVKAAISPQEKRKLRRLLHVTLHEEVADLDIFKNKIKEVPSSKMDNIDFI